MSDLGNQRRSKTAVPFDEQQNEPQLKFLLAAVQDMQAVIRATDSKITALFFGLALPLTKLATIWSVCEKLAHRSNSFLLFIIGVAITVFAASWVLSIAAALRTLFHIDNPSKHISGERPTGVFYSPTLFSISLWDVFFPRRLESAVQFSEFFKSLPSSDLDIRRELTFEAMKLIYIRSVKQARASVAYLAFSIWLVSGGAIWITALILH